MDLAECYIFQSKQKYEMRFIAFPVTEYDEVLLGCQPGQMVERPEDKDRDGL
jgi:hypothetical protein